MTQALINSLNIIPDKTVNLSEKMPNTDNMDFGKIFEEKTNFDTKATNTDYADKTNKAPNNIQTNSKDNKTQTIKNNESKSYNTKTNNASGEAAPKSADKIDTEAGDAIKALKEDTETEETLVNIAIEKNLNLANLAEELVQEDESDTEFTEETTVTEEEEPTMYNELTTLEDPTAVLLLQSQIQKTVTSQDNESAENSKTSLNSQSGSKQLNTANDNSTIFKQFENNLNTKDVSIVNTVVKENTPVSKTENSKPSSVISEHIVKELNVEVVSSQSAEAESSMSDLMQKQSPQEQAARVMIQGDIKYDAVAEASKTSVQVKGADITPSKIIDQISKQLENMFNNSKLNIVLNPGTLGKVNLQLVNAKDGLMAQFTVTTQEARDLLMKGLDGLKESLLAQGVSVDSVTIKLEEAESENLFDWTEQEGSNNGNKHQQARKQKEENEKNFEQMMFDIENEGNV